MRKRMDLTGQRYGQLTVIKEVDRNANNHRQWFCKCDCGNVKIIRMNNLRDGTTKSCGCLGPKRMDLTGDRYGRLTVIKEVNERIGGRCFLCRCECGNESEIYMNALRSGATKSCGCLRDQRASETRTLDVSNERYGRLTAIKPIGKHSTKNVNMWNCKCDCGKGITVRVDHLRSGEVKSCGCLKKEQNDNNLNKSLMKMNVDGVVVPLLKAKIGSNNTSGYKGVYWSKRDKRWVARIGLMGKSYHIGIFVKKDDAAQARLKAEESLHLPYIEALDEILRLKNKLKKDDRD